MIVVHVGDDDGVDITQAIGINWVTLPANMADTIAEHRVGENSNPVHLD